MEQIDPAAAIREATAGLEFDRMRETLAQIVEAAGIRATNGLKRQLGTRLIASFDIVNPYAVNFARSNIGELIREINRKTLDGIQAVISNAFTEGIPPREAARQIKGMIGLTEYQTNVVFNYENKLLDMGMTDIEAKVQAYADKLLRQRALMIGRTETINAASGGAQAAWQSAIDQGFLDKDVEQVWIVARDGCENICKPIAQMPENEHVKVGGYFLTGDMRYITRPPAHPNCRCALGLKL